MVGSPSGYSLKVPKWQTKQTKENGKFADFGNKKKCVLQKVDNHAETLLS